MANTGLNKFNSNRGEKKNLRAKQRNAERKRTNLTKMTAMVHKTPSEQLKALDSRLGVGKGASRERAKIAAKMAK